MKVSDFKTQYNQSSHKWVSGGIESVESLLKHKTKDAKQFRDELTAIYGFLVTTSIPDSCDIALGGEAENFDARVGETVLEVVRALPDGSHNVRRQVADGSTHTSAVNCSPERLAAMVSKALKDKQGKHYSDTRTLLISVEGEDTQEDDELVEKAIAIVRKTATIEPFTAVWLVESGRRKAFCLLPHDA